MKTTTPARMFCAIICLLFISSFYNVFAAPDSSQASAYVPPPPCELCNGIDTPWGEIYCANIPMYGGVCTVKVCYRKRECGNRKQIKLISTSYPPDTPCASQSEDLIGSPNSNILIKMLSEPEPFGLVPPGNQFDFVNIDIFRYGCKISINCPEVMYLGFPIPAQIVNLPCTKKACCQMSFTVRKKSTFCEVEGYSGSQKDYSMVSPRCKPLHNDIAESEGETYTQQEYLKEINKLRDEGAYHSSCLSTIYFVLTGSVTNPEELRTDLQCTPDCRDFNFTSGTGTMGGNGGNGGGTWRIKDGNFVFE